MRPSARHRFLSLGAVGLVLSMLIVASAAWGCAARRRVQTSANADGPGGVRGHATSRFVFDPENPALALPADVHLLPPMPMGDNRMPEYPVVALAAGAGGFAGFRIVVDTDGGVGTFGPSPLIPEMEGRFVIEFRASAEAAVATWKFDPAVLLRTEAGNDLDGDGKPDYRRATSVEKVPVYLDVRFDFEIVNGQGSVHAAGASTH